MLILDSILGMQLITPQTSKEGKKVNQILILVHAGRTKGVSSDLDIKLDFSIRDNKTIVREIQEDVNLITMGQRVFSLKGSTDYVVNDRLNIRFFIDKVLTNPYVSNTFPGATTNIGFSIRFTLAQ